MRSLKYILSAVAFAGIGFVSLSLSAHELRTAIADQACPIEGESGWNYLKSKCKYHKTKGNWCLCVTDDDQSLNGEVTSIDDIPDAALRRYIVCETDTGERFARWVKLNMSVPPGWNCQVVLNKALWRRSMRNTKSRLFKALHNKCCADCQHGCFISPGSWGQCPYCLLDGNCVDYCPAESQPITAIQSLYRFALRVVGPLVRLFN